MWCRSGGIATVPGNSRSSLASSLPRWPGSEVPTSVTATQGRVGSRDASCRIAATARSCGPSSVSTCRSTRLSASLSTVRRSVSSQPGSSASAESSTANRPTGCRRSCTARSTAALPTPCSPSTTIHSPDRYAFSTSLAGPQPQRRRADQPGQHGPGGRRRPHRRHRGGRDDLHLDDPAAARARHRPDVHPGGGAGGQLDHQPAGAPAGQRVRAVPDQSGLVGRVQHRPGQVVHHRHVAVDGEDDPGGAPADPQVLVEQLQLAGAGVGEQLLPDLLGGGLGQGEQQRARVPPPAGQVDRADGLAGDRVVDRHPGAGQVLQVLGVVLVPEHVHRPAALQRGADAVGADELLGVREAGREHHLVQVALQLVAGGEPDQHQPAGVGQHDADLLPLQLVAQRAQHRLGAAGQRGVDLGIADVGQLDPVRGHLQLARSPPGGEDRVPHLVGIGGLGRQEALAVDGDAFTVGRGRRPVAHATSLAPGPPRDGGRRPGAPEVAWLFHHRHHVQTAPVSN